MASFTALQFHISNHSENKTIFTQNSNALFMVPFSEFSLNFRKCVSFNICKWFHLTIYGWEMNGILKNKAINLREIKGKLRRRNAFKCFMTQFHSHVHRECKIFYPFDLNVQMKFYLFTETNTFPSSYTFLYTISHFFRQKGA